MINVIPDISQLLCSVQLKNMDFSSLQDLPCHIYIKDTKGKYLAINPRMMKDVGFTKQDEILGLNDFDLPFLPAKLAQVLIANDQAIMQKTAPEHFFEAVTLGNGNRANLLSCKSRLLTRTRKTLGIIGLSLVQYPSNIPSPTLTPQQIACLILLVKGMTFKQIGKELNLSPRTVEHYIDTIKMKLGVTTRAELVMRALQMSEVKIRL